MMARLGLQNLTAAGNRLQVRVMRIGTLLLCAFFFFGCGDGGSGSGDISDPVSEDLNQSPQSVEKATYEDLIQSDSYAGYLVIFFERETKIRLDDNGELYTLDGKAQGEVDKVNTILAGYPDARIERSSSAPPDQLDMRRARLQRRSGKKLVNWNAVYSIRIEDKADAAKLYNELKAVVKLVHPTLEFSLSSIETTPNLENRQSYLGSYERTAGINAEAAWAAGVTGEGVEIIDSEDGFNFDHEDLSLNFALFDAGGDVIPTDVGALVPAVPGESESFRFAIAHGTAVIGVLAAKDNGHGVKGIAPDARILVTSAEVNLSPTLDFLSRAVRSHERDFGGVHGGKILLIEHQINGGQSAGMCNVRSATAGSQHGCMPIESVVAIYRTIEELTAAGVTVVEGAGNGEVNLGNPDVYLDENICDTPGADDRACIDILGLGGDAGALMVGAVGVAGSGSVELRPMDTSNCGARINVSSRGEGIVTTGYPAEPSFVWGGDLPSPDFNTDPNNYYINNFGGTSSATAIVAGSVALIQSYAKQVMGPKRYITPYKMREILLIPA